MTPKPKLQHSPQRTKWVAGRVATSHPDVDHAKLEQIVADALEGALIHDHDSMTTHHRYGRADSVPAGGSIRADGGNPMTTRDHKRDAHERIKARADAAMDDLRNAHRRPSRGMTKADAKAATVGTRPAAQPEPAPTTAADAFEAMKNAWRK